MDRDFELSTPSRQQAVLPSRLPRVRILPNTDVSGTNDTESEINSYVEDPLTQLSTLKSPNKHDEDLLQREEVNHLHEIVPSLDKFVILEILKGNDFNLERSTDAALALAVSLSVEEGTPVLNVPSATTSAEKSKSKSKDILGSSHRGIPYILDPNFLCSPRFRLVVDRQSDGSSDFTIAFRRQKEKLGITIQEIDGDICIHSLHRRDDSPNSPPLLALEAGVKVGDILTGINSEFFSPGAEIQDVIDMLHLAGNYVTLHFTRRHKAEDSSVSPYHKCAQTLLDQGVINRERAQYVTKAIFRLRERVLQWDSGWITQKMSSEKLEKSAETAGADGKITSLASSAPGGSPSNTSSSGSANSYTNSGLGSGGSNRGGGSSFRAMWRSSSSTSSVAAAELRSDSAPLSTRKSDIVIPTRNLRPALSVRLMRAEQQRDHVVYVIWVMDIKSGAEWVVQRRFREFFEFRDLVAKIRPSIHRLEFPPKRLNVAETFSMIVERQQVLQKFLRRISSLVCVNSLHPSTARVQLALQQFLVVGERMHSIQIMEAKPKVFAKNMVQVFVHSVMQMSVMDKVLQGFVDNFLDESGDEDIVLPLPGAGSQGKGAKKSKMDEAKEMLESMREFLDNLQSVIFDGISEDCIEIISKLQGHEAAGSGAGGGGVGAGAGTGAGTGVGFGGQGRGGGSVAPTTTPSTGNVAGSRDSNGKSSTSSPPSSSFKTSSSSSSRRNKAESEFQKLLEPVASEADDEDGHCSSLLDISSAKTDDTANGTAGPSRDKDQDGDLGPVQSSSSSSEQNDDRSLRRGSGSGRKGSAKPPLFDNEVDAPSASPGSGSPTRHTRDGQGRKDGVESGGVGSTSGGNESEGSNSRRGSRGRFDSGASGDDGGDGDCDGGGAQYSSSSSGHSLHTLDEARRLTIARCSQDDMRAQARSAVRRQVEIEIYVPCARRLRGTLEKAYAQAETELTRKIKFVVQQPQSFFGVPIQHISPSGWDEVVFTLREIRRHTLPHDRLEALADVCKMIPKVFVQEHPEAEKPLGADEFLPIFIYILAHAEVPLLLALNEELQGLCDPDKRLSETGYYLATLEASIQHLVEADVDSGSLFPARGLGHSWDNDDDDDEEEEGGDDDTDEDDGDGGGDSVKSPRSTAEGVERSQSVDVSAVPKLLSPRVGLNRGGGSGSVVGSAVGGKDEEVLSDGGSDGSWSVGSEDDCSTPSSVSSPVKRRSSGGSSSRGGGGSGSGVGASCDDNSWVEATGRVRSQSGSGSGSRSVDETAEMDDGAQLVVVAAGNVAEIDEWAEFELPKLSTPSCGRK